MLYPDLKNLEEEIKKRDIQRGKKLTKEEEIIILKEGYF